jgi:outer membrane protein TolC
MNVKLALTIQMIFFLLILCFYQNETEIKMNCSRKRYLLLSVFLMIELISLPQTRSLEYFINAGLQNSPLLNDLQNQLNSTLIDSLIVRAQRKPQIEGQTQFLYSPYNDHFGYDEVITDGGNYQVTGYVSQNIFNRKVTENKFKAIDNQRLGISLSQKITVAELKRLITGLYLESYSVCSDLTFNSSFLELMKDQNQIIDQFVKAGVFSQSDYLSLLVETQGQEIILSQLRNLYEKKVRLLNEACGIVDTAHIELVLPEINPAETDNKSDYLFVKQFTIDSLQILNERTALGLKYKPSVNWFADAGILTSKPENFYRHFGASAGFSLSIPIFDGQQKKLEDQKLSIRENTRSFNNIISRKQYDQQYLRLKGELQGMKQVRSKLEAQLRISDQLVKSLKSQLETGIAKMTDYLNALRNYRSINHNLNLTDIEMLNILNEMNYILAE